MPVEFHCSECDKLLRVPDESAGKKARCPSCNAIVSIPSTPPVSAPEVGSPFEPPAAPPLAPPPENPFADMAADRGVGGRFPSAKVDDPSNPYASPAAVAAPIAGASAAEGELRPTRFTFDQVFRYTWSIFTDQLGLCIVVALVLIGLAVLGYIALIAMAVGVGLVAAQAKEPAIVAVIIPVALVFGIGAMFAYAWLLLGQAILMIKVARGERANINDLFSGGPYLMKGVGLTFLLAVINVGVSLLFVVPAIVLGEEVLEIVMQWTGNIVNYFISLFFYLCIYFIVDRKLGVFASIEYSFRFMRGNKLTLFLVHLAVGAISLVFMLFTCFIGTIFVMPFWMVLGAVVYLLATGQRTAEDRRVALRNKSFA